ncbi:MAG TPA: hypothetical protein VK157_16190 [Phycisphaerales bacterium]|nr:hypothetical protein [Phycisphaerales bacterium]
MGLDIFVDCRCIELRRVALPRHWENRVRLDNGVPVRMDRQEFEFTDDDVSLSFWFQSSCEHQRGAQAWTSSRWQALTELASSASSSCVDTLRHFFHDSADTNEVSPPIAATALHELNAFARLDLQTAPSPHLVETLTNRVIHACIGTSGCRWSGHDEKRAWFDDLYLDNAKQVVRFMRRERPAVDGTEGAGRQVLSMDFSRWTQQPNAEGDLHRWSIPELKLDILTPTLIVMGEDASRHIPRELHVELRPMPIAVLAEPIQAALRGAVEAGRPLRWSW